MPFSILKKMDEDFKKEQKVSEKPEMCEKEFKEYQNCVDNKKECTDLFEIWMKCNEKPLPERKD